MSIIDPSTYLWDRFGTYLWWTLYIILPVSSVVHLWLYRTWPPFGASPTSPVLKGIFVLQVVLSLTIGLGLLIAPVASTTWWPWPIDAFNGRVYGAAFLAFPTASLVLFRRSSRHELVALGATCLTFGLGAAIGFVKTDLGLGRANWSAPGTLVWEALFLFIAITGAITLAFGIFQRPAETPASTA